MKSLLTTFILGLILTFSNLQAQVTVFTGNGDGVSWHDTLNWDLNVIPNDNIGIVTIPTGFTVYMNSPVLWAQGGIYGEGTVVNNSTLTIFNETPIGHWKSLGGEVHLINNGTLNLQANQGAEIGGLSVLPPGAKLTNTSTGTVNLTSTSIIGTTGSNTAGGTWINQGTINKTTDGAATIGTINFHNQGQVINVSEGTLDFSAPFGHPATHENSIFNISQNATLTITGANNFIGTINGMNEGLFQLTGTHTYLIGDVDLNINGNGLNWASTGFYGDGVLNNYSTIRTDGGLVKGVYDNTTIVNHAGFEINASSNLRIEDQATIINETTGWIQMSGIAANVIGDGNGLINKGEINKLDNETTQFTARFENEGQFDINSALFNFSDNGFNNLMTGRVFGTGTLWLPTTSNPAINNGVFAPGGDGIGKMTVSRYNQNADGELEIQINGHIPELEHDVLDIQEVGTTLEGTITPILSFAPQLDDEFIVVTSNVQDITNCQLPASTVGYFDGIEYTFDIICNTDNIILRVSDFVITSVDELIQLEHSIYPNPSTGWVQIEFENDIEELSVTVHSLTGQLVHQVNEKNTSQIALDLNVPAGMYLVYIHAGENKEAVFKLNVLNN